VAREVSGRDDCLLGTQKQFAATVLLDFLNAFCNSGRRAEVISAELFSFSISPTIPLSSPNPLTQLLWRWRAMAA
jgi:hypothetical protein